MPLTVTDFAFTTDGVVLTPQAKKTAKKNLANNLKNK
jgi:hypothetical protein